MKSTGTFRVFSSTFAEGCQKAAAHLDAFLGDQPREVRYDTSAFGNMSGGITTWETTVYWATTEATHPLAQQMHDSGIGYHLAPPTTEDA